MQLFNSVECLGMCLTSCLFTSGSGGKGERGGSVWGKVS